MEGLTTNKYVDENEPPSSYTPYRQKPHPIDQLWGFIKLYFELHPGQGAILGAIAVVLVVYAWISSFQHPLARHQLHHHYSDQVDREYNFKASQLDHWCLFGGDDVCTCDDFTEPTSRAEVPGWLEAHEANKNRMDTSIFYDVVFVGDDVVEQWNGNWLNKLAPDGKGIKAYFDSTFSTENGGNFDGLALGIAGDSVRTDALMCWIC